MKKVILLAGFPATGKTYMSNLIKQRYPMAMYLSQDIVKEMLYDGVGFDNEEEKESLVDFGREIFYKIVRRSVKQNDLVMLDYPFSHKQLEFLDDLSDEMNVEFLTVRLVGDLDALYNRRIQRDLEPSRNKAHILSSYHGFESYDESTYPLSRQAYIDNCKRGRYDEFVYGKLHEIDVSKYDAIDYQAFFDELSNFITGK